MKKWNGFTLIELLVVIAIIGLISTMSLVVLRGKVMAARDIRRRADISSLQSALELYNFERYHYPGTNGCQFVGGMGYWVCAVDQLAWFLPNLSEYMSPSPPRDPGRHTNPHWDRYGYVPILGTHPYVLFFRLEKGPQEDYCNIGPFSLVEGEGPYEWSTRCPD